MSIFIPRYIQYLIIKNITTTSRYGLVLCNNTKYITLVVNSIKIYKESQTILVNDNNFVSLLTVDNFLTNYIYVWDLFFLKKIKFKGKGYKIWKHKNVLFLIFNHSHITWFISFNILFRKLSKQKFIFMYKNYFYLQKNLFNICNIRPINLFTKRGIRLSKQLVLKKTGKRLS